MTAPIMEAAGLLRAGHQPPRAWLEVYGVATESDGAPAIPPTSDAARGLRAAGRLAFRSGIALAPVLDRLAEVEDERHRAESARTAALAGPRASARTLRWLPAVGVAFAAVVNTAALTWLATSVAGWICVALAATLWWAGSQWLGAIVTRAERAGRGLSERLLPLVLVEAAIAAGRDIAGALADVGWALSEPRLDGAATVLRADRQWAQAWADVPEHLRDVEQALHVAWTAGISPVPLLRARAAACIVNARAASDTATQEAGVAATAPLALCLLPAFIIAGVVPMAAATLQTSA